MLCLFIHGWIGLFLLNIQGMQWFSAPFIKASYKKHYWIASPGRAHCLSSIFKYSIFNSPPPTKIISSLHKIQIIGEWHDLTNEPQAFDGWCESPRGSLLFWLVSTSDWLALLLDEGPHPHAYQPRDAVDVLTSQSLFTNYFTHYGSRCAQPHPVHSASGIRSILTYRENSETVLESI